jgi:hypothetical protein
VPVLDHLVSISAGLVPEPAFCRGAGVAERSQETLYERNFILNFFLEFLGDVVPVPNLKICFFRI